MFNFLISSFTTLLQVFFGLPTCLLPSTSSSIEHLSQVCYSHPLIIFCTWPNHFNLIFLHLSGHVSPPHISSSSELFISNPVLSFLILLTCIYNIYNIVSRIVIVSINYVHVYLLSADTVDNNFIVLKLIYQSKFFSTWSLDIIIIFMTLLFWCANISQLHVLLPYQLSCYDEGLIPYSSQN